MNNRKSMTSRTSVLKRYRSAVDGRYITKPTADRNKRESVGELIKVR